MKRLRYIMLLAGLMSLSLQTIYAQRITRSFRNTSMSEALTILAKSTKDYRINFMYDELEDFTVTTSIVKRTAPDAIRLIMGFYPMKMTIDGENIFVECTQKTPTKMIGRIIDNKNRPVDFANVALLNVRDSSLINGGVTNENGQFVIPCEARKVIVRVSCVGYITTSNTYNTGKIGSITLKEATMNLQKVIVKAVRPRTKLTHGGFQTQVQGTLLSDVGMVSDLLKQIPRVRVNADGGCSVFGKGTPEIYINGRKVTDTKELQHLSSKEVKSVDVITNPGAQYSAEVGSVIRIHTIKKQGTGLSGSLYSKYSFVEKNNWIENLNLNYRMGGLDIFSLLAWNDTYRHLSQTTETTIMGNQHQVNLAMPYSGTLRSHNPYGKWGMNYQIDDNNSFGVFYSVYNNTYEYFNLQSDYEVKEDGKHAGKVKYDDDESSTIQGPVHEADAYYEGKLGKMSVNLNATALWSSDKTYQDAVEMSEELGSRDVNSITRNKRRMLAGKLELGYPLSEKVNLNVGTEYTNSHVHNFYQNEQEYIATSDSRIEEQNFAAFANIDLAIGNHIGLQAGARYEHVSHDCSEREMSRTYDNVFPTFSLGYQKGKLQMEWSASMKTQRPSYDVLSGFTRYDNRYIYEGGNPSLLPTNIYNLGWDVQYGWLGFSANYGYNKHAITTLEMLYDTTSDILLSKPYNIDNLQVMDLSLVATPVFGFWHPMWELDFEQQFVNGEKYGYHGNLRKPQFSVRLNNWFSLSHDWSANVDYFISSSHSSSFSEVGSVSALNLSVKKMFLKKSLSIQLEANDLFHGLNDNQKSFATCMSMFKKCKMNSRSFALTVTYNFNATKSKYKGTGAGNAEKSRL